ncbi:MAG: EAL domain-containing protein [Sphingobium sp.]|nr:EAL domain-containing protein [Sphingobium sp.]
MLLNFFKIQTDDKELAAAVRVALLKALYASQLSLAIGTGLGLAVSGVIAWYCPSPWIIVCGALMSATGLLRVLSFGMFKPGSADANAKMWERIYETGALAYAFLIGQMTLLTFAISDDLGLQLLAAFASTGYAAGATGRNTGRPLLALAQLVACALPLSIAPFFHFTLPGLVVAIANMLYIGVLTDITLRTYKTVLEAFVDKQEKLRMATVYEHLSKTDPLTGMDNRTNLNTHLEAMLDKREQRIAILWLDLDRFKQINDTLGHGTGDAVLRTIAHRLSVMKEPGGRIARFGGDEFIVTLPVADEVEAMARAEELISSIRKPVALESLQVDISCSIGISVSDETSDSDELLRHADVALYEAKAAGRNCIRLFDPEMERRLLESKQIERDLKRALARNEMSLHFQPVVDLDDFRIKSFEALLRWQHPTTGNVPPSLFIPIAEASHNIGPITEWVLHEACVQAMSWPGDIAVAVNISASLLTDRELPVMVSNTLLKTGLPPRRLHLEITETALLADDPNVRYVLEMLTGIGAALSLDDFGTGFSSLSHLCRHRFDTIKIDRSFLNEVESRSESRAVIQAISGLASSLHLTVVAEGIETYEQLRYIVKQGCSAGQGYFFAKPMPAAAVAGYLATADEELAQFTREKLLTHAPRSKPKTRSVAA